MPYKSIECMIDFSLKKSPKNHVFVSNYLWSRVYLILWCGTIFLNDKLFTEFFLFLENAKGKYKFSISIFFY